MNRLLKIARSGLPGTGVQFCEEAYGNAGIQRFLRDVLAMANASVDGNRYIVTGIRFDESGERQVNPIDHKDFLMVNASAYTKLVTAGTSPT